MQRGSAHCRREVRLACGRIKWLASMAPVSENTNADKDYNTLCDTTHTGTAVLIVYQSHVGEPGLRLYSKTYGRYHRSWSSRVVCAAQVFTAQRAPVNFMIVRRSILRSLLQTDTWHAVLLPATAAAYILPLMLSCFFQNKITRC